jgi:hypothetical protein
MCLDNTTLPARLVTRNRLRPLHHGLIPVHLVRCLFLLPLLCVAYSCAVVDKKDRTTGAIHTETINFKDTCNFQICVVSPAVPCDNFYTHHVITLVNNILYAAFDLYSICFRKSLKSANGANTFPVSRNVIFTFTRFFQTS